MKKRIESSTSSSFKKSLLVQFQRKAHEKEDWETSNTRHSRQTVGAVCFREKLMKKRIERRERKIEYGKSIAMFQRKAHEKEDWEGNYNYLTSREM